MGTVFHPIVWVGDQSQIKCPWITLVAVSYLVYHFAGLVARRDHSVAGGSQLVQPKDGKVDVVDNEV